MSARPVRTYARVHRVVEVARLALKKPVNRCRNLVRMSAKGRELPPEPGTKRMVCTTSFSEKIGGMVGSATSSRE
jgi:hypothetical protein